MADSPFLRRVADFYVRRAGLIGFLYGVVPCLIGYAWLFFAHSFRSVYVLRFVLSLPIAGLSGACMNRYGLEFWLTRHRSPEGPATVLDGMMVGAWIGVATAFVTPFLSLIGTNHPEQAKSVIIWSWLSAALIGLVWGGIITALAGEHVPRDPAE